MYVSLLLLAVTILVTVTLMGKAYPIDLFVGKIREFLGSAIVVGMLTSILGYIQKTKPEECELEKLVATIFLALLISVLTTCFGMTYTQATDYAATGAFTIWVYWFAQAITKYIKTWFPDLFGTPKIP